MFSFGLLLLMILDFEAAEAVYQDHERNLAHGTHYHKYHDACRQMASSRRGQHYAYTWTRNMLSRDPASRSTVRQFQKVIEAKIEREAFASAPTLEAQRSETNEDSV